MTAQLKGTCKVHVYLFFHGNMIETHWLMQCLKCGKHVNHFNVMYLVLKSNKNRAVPQEKTS